MAKKQTGRVVESGKGGLSFHTFCDRLGRDAFHVKGLQRALDLPAVAGYSGAYLRFMQKVVALRIFSVPVDRIAELFDLEKKILRLLHIDSLGEGARERTYRGDRHQGFVQVSRSGDWTLS